MMKYLRMWMALLKYSLIREFEFRLNFLGRASIEVMWIGTQLGFFAVAFQFMDHIGNFSKDELWFFLGTLFLVDGFYMALLHDGQTQFGRVIRNGLLDFHLLRPAPGMFLALFRNVNPVSLTNIALAVAVLAMAQAKLHLGWQVWLWWLIQMPAGLILVLSLGVITTSIAFWTTQTSNLVWIFFELYRLGFRPETLYAPWLRRFLTVIFPAAFFASIPVQICLGKLSGVWIFLPWLVAAGAATLAVWVWQRGVRVFEGAMS
jgi:ABC-2 type transport system permease protein